MQMRDLLLVFLGVFLIDITLAQVSTRNADLKESASVDSRTVRAIPENSKLTILQRTGFWVRVTADTATGWLKLTDVRYSTSAGGSVNLSSLDSGRTGSNNIVSSSASRGLSAKELSDAAPDFVAVHRLVSLSRNEDLLKSFRNEGGLTLRSFPPIAPVAPTKELQATTVKSKLKNDDW